MSRKRYGLEQLGMLGFVKNPKKYDSSNNSLNQERMKGYQIPYFSQICDC